METPAPYAGEEMAMTEQRLHELEMAMLHNLQVLTAQTR
jgi:hypothetical protein